MSGVDDFNFVNTSTTPVTAINWWGTVSSADMFKRNFYIAIYNDLGGLPDLTSFVWWDSVKLKNVVPQGVDCYGKKVYKFFADIKALNLPTGHLWIQISEDDGLSTNPGQPDFWWSAHQPVLVNKAVQLDFFASPSYLIDPFNGQQDDLAFEIL
jgi:hypothetical protein